MKKVLLAFSVITLFMLSCGPKVDSPLIGKWKLDDISAAKITVAGSGDTSALGTMGDTLAQGLADMANAFTSLGSGLADAFLKGSIYEFKSNGTVTQSILFSDTDGKFKISDDKKSVTLTMPDANGKDSDEVYTITSVDDSKLVLTTKENMNWTFSKQ
jgi:hypothetical protein